MSSACIKILDALFVPEAAKLSRRVPKTLLLESAMPTLTDKRLLISEVGELTWYAALKPEVIGVPGFRGAACEYLEIHILCLALKTGATHGNRVAELIHRAIPYPVFLITEEAAAETETEVNNGEVLLSLANIRNSRSSVRETVLEEPLFSVKLDTLTLSQVEKEFLSALSVEKLSRQNLYVFYQNWAVCFEALVAARISGYFSLLEGDKNIEMRRTALAAYERISREIAVLQSRAKDEVQINRRVELNLEVRNLRRERELLLEKI
jgi:hypothetical protein